uniref:BcDNA.GH11110 (inferred by orthology to a D. melanogaster protein) n=1 Tax=Strongyloides venezuelensis TaxID=75913 RepID=A0A0K0EWJ9_STRVS
MGKSRRSRSDSSSSGTESETGSLSDSDSNHEGEITARSISKSPRPQSTVVVKRDITNRSRKDSRQYLSKFYKERFGSHSPDEYVNLRLSNFDMKLSKDEIRRHLEEEFKELAPFEIKVVRNPDDDRRLAYVNFTKRDSAKYVRQNMISSLQHYLGKNLFVDPAGVLRDQEGKYIPDRYNRALQAQHENRSPNRNGRKDNRNGMNRRVVGSMPTFNLKQGDSDATRTLFVGNMPADISESEIRKTFEQYGVIEDIDIKNPADTNAAYAFVLFQKLQSAIDALKNEHDKSIRPNSNKVKIGYGKSQPSSRLWIGGLGPWASIDLLLKAFEKFGIVEVIDYKEGDDIAYIKFDSQSAAFEAFNKMKGYTFDRPDTHILVDYAKEDTNRLKIHSLKKDKDPVRHDRHRRSRDHSRSRSSSRSSHRGHTSAKRDTRKRGHSISSDSSSEIPVRKKHHTKSPTDKTTADLRLSSLEELQKKLAATWIGKVTIKKQEYMIKGYRIAGEEKLVQTVLRDEMGIPHLLKVTQRLPLKNRENLTDRFLHQPYNRIAVMIATEHPNTDYPLYKLREYFHEKDAAGLVTVDETGGMVYVVPPSEVSDETLTHFAPGVTFVRPGVNCLMIVIGQQETFTDGLREE